MAKAKKSDTSESLKGRARSKSQGRKPADASAGSPRTAVRPRRSRSRTPTRKRSVSRERKAKSTKKSPNRQLIVKMDRIDDNVIRSSTKKSPTSKKTPPGKKSSDLTEEQVPILDSPAGAVGKRQSSRVATQRISQAVSAKDHKVSHESKDIAETKSSWGHNVPGFMWTIATLLWALTICAVCLQVTYMAGKPDCSLSNMRVPVITRKMVMDIDKKGLAMVAGFMLFQAILQLVPLGKVADGPATPKGRSKFRQNGLFAFLVTLGLIPFFPAELLDYLKDTQKLVKELLYSFAFAFILSLILYIKARKLPATQLNPLGNTGRSIVNWHMGREINPRFFNFFSVKTFLFRVGIIGMSFIVGMYPYLLWKEKQLISPTLTLATVMQLLYAVQPFWDEAGYLHTFEFTSNGVGFESCTMLAYPITFSIYTRFIYTSIMKGKAGVELSTWTLALLSLSWLVGFLIMFVSNRVKNGYRQNPTNSKYQNLETQGQVTTRGGTGKRLICSGLWGWVRHPNYFGDIIQAFCWAATTGTSCGVFYVYPFLLVIFLWFRAVRVEEICSRKHGIAWDKYCLRVPNRIFPGIHF
ncbi:unnamed protein product [Cyprideis torosa]|uniref:Uncharacterized protein n=1 Tax=Cyprideis torosa TaxID=163714 RepID=A0A7R8W0S7_9CRUS|nr:unnamed protein product [Cyprideis torosa]CAG0880090.1 unnamed protein product [Cyprideis torosa]